MTRLNLGAGDHVIKGYISVDKYDKMADIKADICDLPFDNDSVDEIIASQVVEHIPYNKTYQMFSEMYRVLKKGSLAHIECPDVLYAAQKIVESGDIEDLWLYHLWGEYYRPWDKERYEDCENHEGSKHVTGFTFNRIKRICEPIGFKVKKVEPVFIKVAENLAVDLVK